MPEGIGYGKKARARVSRSKAKKILEDGSVNGKPLSAKQKRFFGAIAGGARMKKMADGGAVGGSAKDLILQGFKEGGAVRSRRPILMEEKRRREYERVEGLKAVAKVAEEKGEAGVQALRLGQALARAKHRKSLGQKEKRTKSGKPLAKRKSYTEHLRESVGRAEKALT